MELSLIKYFGFLIGSTLAIGLLMLWLKGNRLKRKQETDTIEK